MSHTTESTAASAADASDKPTVREAGKSPVPFMLIWFGLPLVLILLSEVFGLSRTVDGWVSKASIERTAATHHVRTQAHPAQADPVPAVGKPTMTDTPAPGKTPVAPR